MSLLLGLSHHTGVRLAEVAFLLVVIGGVWLVAAEIPQLKSHTSRTIVAGALFAAAGVLLIVATHWGHYG